MARINHVIFQGRVFRVSEVKTFGDKRKCEIRVRQSYPKKKRPDGSVESFHTDWVSAVCWGMCCDIAQEVQQNDYITIEGRLKHEEWESKDGENKSRLVINATYIHREPKERDVTPPAVSVSSDDPPPF